MRLQLSFILCLSYSIFGPSSTTPCGGNSVMGDNETRVLQSPNYPQNYSNYENCVWILEVPNSNVVQLFIERGFEGESVACRDFLEVRDGNFTANLLGSICKSRNSSISFRSSYKYMWVHFRSNDKITNKGFKATWTAINTNVSTNFLLSCPSPMFQCPNYNCIEWSSVCNGWNDCGVQDTGWDEDSVMCTGISISKYVFYAAPICTSLIFMIILFVMIGLSEHRVGCFKNKEKSTTDDGKDFHLILEQLGMNQKRYSIVTLPNSESRRSTKYLIKSTENMVPYNPGKSKDKREHRKEDIKQPKKAPKPSEVAYPSEAMKLNFMKRQTKRPPLEVTLRKLNENLPNFMKPTSSMKQKLK